LVVCGWSRPAVLFGIIVLFTLLQRLVLGATGGDRSSRRLERAELLAKAKTTQQAAAGTTVP
jgi:hypothetical protein